MKWWSDAESGEEESKPFLDHLEDLRRMFIKSIATLVISMIVAIPFAPQILEILKAPLAGVVEDPGNFLISTEITGAFSVIIRVAFWSGLLISSPLLMFFIGEFVFPGLKINEKRVIRKSLGAAVGLFLFGVLLGYFITLEVGLGVMFRLHDWIGIQAMPRITNYVAFCTQILIAFGLAFEMPLVVLILGRMGIVNSTQLREKRRHIIVILLVLAMMLTPPDVITQMLMAGPLVILYEACIWILRATERREAEAENQD